MNGTIERTTISLRGDLLEKAKKQAGNNFQSLSSYIAALIHADDAKDKSKTSRKFKATA